MTLSYDQAVNTFKYDKDSGFLIWLKSGKKAGYVSSSDGYITVMFNGKNYKAHRIAWLIINKEWPDKIDHIDHCRTNNKISNLRNVTTRQNGMNMSKRSSNKSGHVGVCWNKKAGKWQSYVTVEGRSIYLGVFTNKEDAILARDDASKKIGFHKNHGL